MTALANVVKMTQQPSSKFTDNYELKEELGKVMIMIMIMIISRPRVARAGTNKLKCQKNIRCILDQKPPQSAKFWRNFDGL